MLPPPCEPAEVPPGLVVLELATPDGVPCSVADWLHRPLRTRMIGPDYEAARDRGLRVGTGPCTSASNS
ncbi:hypothetical protein FHR84_004034 [Actinopolyspora biskrensis]|uniref:Uncharacterized protein n=1 Tax=Actinopolyspora biskrensis TaxID=1470178 RepID=A0A852Z2B9_9ACTN|nr:hypothetical protein [Actinopolyspora biskrensis]NYH80668.1 hypothetical protein [Actinopolyspora biskrensis]